MSIPGLKNWQSQAWKPAGGNQTLQLHFRNGDEAVLDVAKSYWERRLGDLSLVRFHKWGGRVEKNDRYYFKRFTVKRLRFLHKPLRGRSTLIQEQALEDKGFRVPKSVCLIERRVLGILVESVVISETLGDVESLFDMKVDRGLLMKFAQEVGRFHAAGFFHGDLNLNNVLCRPDPADFFWMDNEEGRRFESLPLKFRIHDLNHINRGRSGLSQTDRLRMWKTYLAETAISPEVERACRKEVLKQTKKYRAKRGW